MTGKTTSMRWPPPLRSSGISEASVGSAVIITRCPSFRTSGSIFCAALPTSQWPSLLMPIGTASYLSGSRPRITEAAEARETSCSPERPPKRMPTRIRFLFSGVTGPISHSRQVSVIRENRGCGDGCFRWRSELTTEDSLQSSVYGLHFFTFRKKESRPKKACLPLSQISGTDDWPPEN